MTDHHATHPPVARLIAFAVGAVEDSELEAIADHLSVCDKCCNELKLASPQDPLLERLQAASRAEPATREMADASRAAVKTLLSHQQSRPEWVTTRSLPEQVQQYRIVREVGRGGMGVVYQAIDVVLNRPVALKVILAGQYAAAEQLVRFRQEAEMAARVRHPNVVQVYEVGEFRGQPFVAFEWIDGGSLCDRLKGRPPQLREAVELVETLARAVHAAHCHGVVHRDLKPSNILLSGDTPKIADFGLARPLDDERGLTVTGSVLGTPEYMAPEQANGRFNVVGPACDIYALGVILFESLAGRPPFRGSTSLGTLRLVTESDPPRIDAVSERSPNSPGRRDREQKIGVDSSGCVRGFGCPHDLETIALKCLKKLPSQRYVTAGFLADDLRRFLNGEPITARPVGRIERTWSWCRRYPVVAGLLAALVISLVSGVIVSTMFAYEARDQARQATFDAIAARKAEQSANTARRMSEQAVRLAQARAYDANVLLLQNAWEQHQMPRFHELLKLQVPVDESLEDFRNFEWYYWRNQLNAGHGRLETQHGQVNDIDINPDRKLLATCGLDGKIRLWDIATRGLHETLSGHAQSANAVCFSPTSTTLLASAGQDGTVRMWNIESGAELFRIAAHDGGCYQIRFSPDGTTIVSAGPDGAIRFWDAATGEATTKLAQVAKWPNDGEPGSVRFDIHPDGIRFAWSDPFGNVQLCELPSQQVLQSWKAHTGHLSELQFSPDGRWLVTTGAVDFTARVWNTETGAERCPSHRHPLHVIGADWNGDSNQLATFGYDRTSRLFDADNGLEFAILKGHFGFVLCGKFLSNGSNGSAPIVTGGNDGTLRFWNSGENPNPIVVADAWSRPSQLSIASSVATVVRSIDEEPLNLPNPVSGAECAYSAIPGSNKTIHIVDAANGRIAKTLQATVQAHGVSFLPDGESLLAANYDNSITHWNLEVGRIERTFTGHTAKVNGLAVHPCGTAFASAGDDHTIRIWNLTDDAAPQVLMGHTEAVYAVAFNPAGTLLASASFDHTIKLWDVSKTDIAKTTGNVDVRDLVKRQNNFTFRERQTLTGHGNKVFGLSFNADGTQLASASEDQTARLWDIATGKVLTTFTGHGGPVRCVAFTPDNKRLATGSWDRRIILWDTLTGQEVTTLNGHTDEVMCVQFTRNGQRLLSFGGDSRLNIWNAERENLYK